MDNRSSSLQSLISEGFEYITEWARLDGKTVLADLTWDDTSGLLYAFVMGNTVMYVGVTGRILRSRTDNSTDNKEEKAARIRALITKELEAGRAVMVYGRSESDSDKLVSEEARLRKYLDPAWNRR